MSEQTQSLSVGAEPKVDRPDFPKDYGIPEDDEGQVPWSSTNDWLAETKIFWIATTWPDGRPHANPIWGAWVDNKFFFDGSPKTRWGRNIAENPAIVVHIERGDAAVMVEGIVEDIIPDPEIHKKIRESYGSRYDYIPKEGEHMYRVTPSKAFAWAEFPTTVTRYKF